MTERGIEAAIEYFRRAYGAGMPSCNQWDYIHSDDRVTKSVNAVGGVTWPEGGYGIVEDRLRVLYPNSVCSVCTPTWKCEVPANGYESDGCGNRRLNPICNLIIHPGETIMKTWTINTQKDLKGTVGQTAGYLLWHITAPFVRDVSYGGPDATPATWIDEKGVEQVAVIQMNAWGKADVALDSDRSFGFAEEYKEISEVDVLSEKAGYTVQLRYPKGVSMGTVAIGVGLLVGVMYVVLKKKKGR